MLVPEMVTELASLPIQAEVMLLPGAKISTQVPQLEKDDRASLLVVDPTVMAAEAEAGEAPHASAFSFSSVPDPKILSQKAVFSESNRAPPNMSVTRRETIKMPSQTPMVPWKVRKNLEDFSCCYFLLSFFRRRLLGILDDGAHR